MEISNWASVKDLERRVERLEKLHGIGDDPAIAPCILAYKYCGHDACKEKEHKE